MIHDAVGREPGQRIVQAGPTPQPVPTTIALPDPEPDFDPEDLEPRPLHLPDRRRVAYVLCVLLAVLLALVLPPLLNVNRFRRQTASSIAASLGRPVHMDSLTLSLLPLPALTLTNFIVSEDPTFGAEPVIRANSVRATLRWSSLWRRRVEFSRISFDETSLNLVQRSDGRWNIESILLQASRMEAAPTAQQAVGRAPRFPYIEAANARVNVKRNLEKLPISLTDAEFALWLPQPQQWKLRLQGHPTRTDSPPADTGRLRLQGTLGKAEAMPNVPVDLSADWTLAPLGAVSTLLTGTDAGFRGEMNLHASILGTLGVNTLETRLQLTGVHRADFVPAQTLDAGIACKAQAVNLFHRLTGIRCASPPNAVPPSAAPADAALPSAGPAALTLTGQIPAVAKPSTAILDGTIANLPADRLLAVLRLISQRVPAQLVAGGQLSGDFSCCATPKATFHVPSAQLVLPNAQPFVTGADLDGQFSAGELTVSSVPLDLGGALPATVDVQANRTGLRLHLTGSVLRSRLLAFAAALPQLGDGLREALPAQTDSAPTPELPLHVDLIATRPWLGVQTWTLAPIARTPTRRKHLR